MYLSYTEYQSMGGTLSEAEFNRLAYRAEQKIKNHTHGRIEIADTRVKMCMFDLISLAQHKNTSNAKSVSNDGFSITYKGEAEQDGEDYAVIYDYFADTDMLYRGADGVGNYEPEIVDDYDYLMVLGENGNYEYLMILGENGWDYLKVLRDAS